MTLPHTLHLAAHDLSALHALRQQSASPNFAASGRTERSASTSTSGYGTSTTTDSNSQHISLVGHMAGAGRSGSASGGASGARDSISDPSSGHVELHGGPSTSSGKSSKKDEKDKGDKSESKSTKKDKEKDRIARYLANSKRRASRPFRRAKTLLESHMNN